MHEPSSSVARGRGGVNAPVLVQFIKFGIVGVSNTLLTLVVYTVLLKGFGVWYLAASAIGFIAGAINGFLLNRRWTFRDHVGDALHAGSLGDRPDGRARARRADAVRAGSRREARQAAGAGVCDGARHRHDVLRQSRVDVPRTRADRDRRRRRLASRVANGRRRAARDRRGCDRHGRSTPPRARAGARAAS